MPKKKPPLKKAATRRIPAATTGLRRSAAKKTAASAAVATRTLDVVVTPVNKRLESLFVFELGSNGRRVDPAGGTFVVFDPANRGTFDAKVGRRYDFDWMLRGKDDDAVKIEFLYPDGTVAARVPESATKIVAGRGRQFGVDDLPPTGVIV